MENMENKEPVEVIETSAPAEVVTPAPSGKNMSIAALVCGILGLVGGFIPVVSYFTFILSILGIVFGAKGKKMSIAANEPTGMATAGLVLGIVGVALSVLGIMCAVCALCGLGALSGM